MAQVVQQVLAKVQLLINPGNFITGSQDRSMHNATSSKNKLQSTQFSRLSKGHYATCVDQWPLHKVGQNKMKRKENS